MIIKQLEKKIKEAQNAYYNDDPIMSDEDFDALWDELKKKDPDNELFKTIGEDHIDGFKKVKHAIVMGSQHKATTEDEMDKFFKKNGTDMIAQLKLDGISVDLVFYNGKFKQAISRGNSVYGDDITSNVMKMKGVKKQIDKSFTGSVRGEILLLRKDKEKYFPNMKNCRNAASGISKRLDGEGSDKLTVICYDAQYANGKSFGTQENLQEWLDDQGFRVAFYTKCKKATGKQAMKILNQIFAKFDSLDYDIDGIVWKKNQIDIEDMRNLRPETQIALKPARTEKSTKLIDIQWNLVSGTYTPIGIIEPIELNGTTVRKASLSNINQLIQLGIEIGDNVVVSKRGMIIPKIERKANKGD